MAWDEGAARLTSAVKNVTVYLARWNYVAVCIGTASDLANISAELGMCKEVKGKLGLASHCD